MAIKITLTEFMNFVNKSGSAKATVVRQAKKRHENNENPYTPGSDYWYYLRKQIQEMHKNGKTPEFLDEVFDVVLPDRRENYQIMVNGYKSFLGVRKRFEYVTPTRKTWTIGDLNIALNPELTLVHNGEILVIKLFLSANDSIDRKRADLILTLMENEMRNKVGGEEPIFAVLDVRKHKLFKQNNRNLDLMGLLKGEAKSFEIQWKEMD